MAIKIKGSTIINDDRVLENADKIGIGTTNPQVALEIFSGDVGIGTTNPSASNIENALDSNPNILAVGIVTANEYYGTFKGSIDTDAAITNADKINIQTNSDNTQKYLTFVSSTSSHQDLFVNTGISYIPDFYDDNTDRGKLDITGDVSIGGTLTVEDITSVDSLGIITARQGIHVVTGAGVSIALGGLNVSSGISTFGGNLEPPAGGTDTYNIGKSANLRWNQVYAKEYYGTFKGTIDPAVSDDRIAIGTAKAQVVDNNDGNGHFFVETEGTERFRIVGNGSVGINSSTPNDYELDVVKRTSSEDAEIRLYNYETGSSRDTIMRFEIAGTESANYIYFGDGDDTNAGQIVYAHNDDSMRFFVNSPSPDASAGERLRITSSGDVGIGTDDPIGSNAAGVGNTAVLAVGIITAREYYGTFKGTIDPETADDRIEQGNTKAQVVDDDNTGPNGYFLVETGGTERLRITSDGKVGIGTTNPEEELHIRGDSNACVRITCDFGGSASYQFGDHADSVIGGLTFDNSDNSVQLRGYDRVSGESNITRLHINEDGNIGIGTTNPTAVVTSSNTATLAVGIVTAYEYYGTFKGNVDPETAADRIEKGNTKAQVVDGDNGGPDGHFLVETGGTERLRILANGNVGIGTTQPPNKFQVGIGTTSFNITSEGLVSIGTTLPSTNNPLTVHGYGNHIFMKDIVDNNILQIRQRDGIAEFNTYASNTDRRAIVFSSYTSERLRITEGGKVGIGTSDPDSNMDGKTDTTLAVAGIVTASEYYGLFKGEIDSTVGILTSIIKQGNTKAEVVDTGTGTNGYFLVETEGTERLRIDKDGNISFDLPTTVSNQIAITRSSILKNTTAATPRDDFNIDGDLKPISQIASTWNAYHSITRHDASIYGPYLMLAKNRNNAYNSNTIVQDDDEFGNISFFGNDGTRFLESVRIRGVVDGTPASNQMPGALTFWTNNGIAVAEKVRITSYGDVGIGTDIPNSTVSAGNTAILAVGVVTANEYYGTFKGDIDPGTAITNAEKIKIQENSENGTKYLTFVSGTSGYKDVLVNTNISYNPNFESRGIGKLTIDGDVGIAGTLTVEDVTNVDSIGLITARQGIHVLAGAGVSIVLGGLNVSSGISTFGGNVGIGTTNPDAEVLSTNTSKLAVGIVTAREYYGTFKGTIEAAVADDRIQKDDTKAQVVDDGGSNGYFFVQTEGTERLRIDKDGKVAYNYNASVSSIADVDIRSNNGVHIRGEDGNADNANIYLGGAANNQRKTAIIHDPVGGYCRGDLHFCLENTADLTDVDVTDTKMVIKANGNVGIGTTNPDAEVLNTNTSKLAVGIVTANEFRGGTFYGLIDSGVNLVANTVKTVKITDDAAHYLTFVNSNNNSATAENMYTDEGITYNPSTNQLGVTTIKALTIKDSSDGTGTTGYVIKADGSGGWSWGQVTGESVGIAFTDLSDTPNTIANPGDDNKVVTVSSGNLIFTNPSNVGKTYDLNFKGTNGGSAVGIATWTLSDGTTTNDDSVTLKAGSNISISSVDETNKEFTIEAVQGAGVGIAASASDVLNVNNGQIGGVDAGDDNIVFWDDSESKLTYLTVGNGLSITGTEITATSDAGKTYTLDAVDSGDNAILRLSDGTINDDVTITAGSNITIDSVSAGGFTIAAEDGAGLGVAASADDILSVTNGQIAGVDAGSDKIVFWDNGVGEEVGKLTYLTVGNGLQITGTTINANSNAGKTYTLPVQGTNGGSGVGIVTWTLTDDVTPTSGIDPVTLKAGSNISISSVDETNGEFTIEAVQGAGVGVAASASQVLNVTNGDIGGQDAGGNKLVYWDDDYDSNTGRLDYLGLDSNTLEIDSSNNLKVISTAVGKSYDLLSTVDGGSASATGIATITLRENSDANTDDDVKIQAGDGIVIKPLISADGFEISADISGGGGGGISDVQVKQYSDSADPRNERNASNPIDVQKSVGIVTIGIGSTSNAYGNRFIGPNEPSGPIEGDIWYDTTTTGQGTDRVAVLRDEKSSGTYGGRPGEGEYVGYRAYNDPTANPVNEPNSWFPRNINTEYDPNSFVSVGIGSTNTFTLEAGSYKINWRVPGFHCDAFQSRIAYNTNSDFTGITSYYYGSSQFSGNSPTPGNWSDSVDESEGEFITTISATTYFRIEQWIGYAPPAVSGGLPDEQYAILGVALGRTGLQPNNNIISGIGNSEIYTQIRIEDLSTAVKDGGFTNKIQQGDTKAEVLDTGSDGQFIVTTEGVERIIVDSSGYLNARADIRLRRTASNDGGIYFGDSNNNFIFGADSVEVLNLTAGGSGNFVIGETVTTARTGGLSNVTAIVKSWNSATLQLGIYGKTGSFIIPETITGASASWTISSFTTTNEDVLTFATAGDERFRITSDGDALFGGLTSQANNDTSNLAVKSVNSNIGILKVHSDGGEIDGDLAGISFSHGGYQNAGNSTQAARAKAAIAFESRGGASFGYGRGDLCFYVDNAGDNNQVSATDEKLRITMDGDVGIGTTNPTASNIKTALDINTKVLAVGVVTCNELYVDGNQITSSGGGGSGGSSDPVGTIVAWAGSVASIPSEYQLCDGSAASTSALQVITGTNVPDLRSRFIVGANNVNGTGSWPNVGVGSTGGSANAVLVAHNHEISTNDGDGSGTDGKITPSTGDSTTNITTRTEGKDAAGNDNNSQQGTNANLPPYYALCYIIKHTASSGSGGGTGTTKVAVLQDVKAPNTHGGAATANSWNQRILNSKIDLENFVTIVNGSTGKDGTANTFTLEAGTYLLQWRAPGWDSGNMRAKMAYTTDATNYNTLFATDGSTGVSYLNGESAQSNTSDTANKYATGSATVTISQTTYFRLQHYIQQAPTTYSGRALGHHGSVGDEIYSQVIIQDLTTSSGGSGKIQQGNTKAEVIDTNGNGYFIVETEGEERLKVTDSGTLELRKNEPQIQFIDTDDVNENTKTQLIHNGGDFYVDLRDGADDGQLIIRGKGGDTPTEKLRISNRDATFANHADVTLNGGGGIAETGSVKGVLNLGSSYKSGTLNAGSGSWEAIKLYVYKDTFINNVYGLGISNGMFEIQANSNIGFFASPFSNNNNQGGVRTKRMVIDTSGNIGAPTGSNIYSASDSRLKKNVVTLDKGLSEINSLRPVSFNWIDDYIPEETDTLYGFIAQEVQTVDSNLVHSFASTPIGIGTDPLNPTQTITDPLRVDEKLIVPMLVKAVQELSAKNDALEARIAALEG